MEATIDINDYLSQLNPSQREAVEYCDGSQLVIAGAGSGKTRVLTCKIAYLLSQGLPPWSIMALTFTNKAAGEMRERIAAMVGDSANKLYMGTFHSVFARLLRREAQHLGFTSNYTIYDDADSRAVIASIVKEMELVDAPYKPNAIQSIISRAKNQLVDAEAYSQDSRAYGYDKEAGRPLTGEIYKRYTERLRRSNAMDFDDLLMLTYQLFDRCPDVLQHYASAFRYILVDEYQDTNHAQHKIVQQLSEVHHRVCVVGDDAQSIYAFRGADIDNILNFGSALDGARLFKLEQNYRSTQCIVEAANSLIKKNQRQIPKQVYSKKDKGEPLTLIETWSDDEEAIVVRKHIEMIKRQENCRYQDFAILYRTNVQSRKFEEELRKYAIPYLIYGGIGFYQHKEIKDVIAYFRLAVNPNDDEAFRRIVNYPARGIGNTTLTRVAEAAERNATSLIDVASRPDFFGLQVSKATATKLIDFAEMMNGFADKAETTDANDLGKEIIEQSGLRDVLAADDSVEGTTRRENIEELVGSLRDFVDRHREEGRDDLCSLGVYLQEVSLMTDADRNQTDTDCVRLMTVHSAKGLEFATVFIVGLEENLFPSEKSRQSMRAMEEERRLFYVAITRAERHCYITTAGNRYMYGKMTYTTPSRFINDIDPKLIQREGKPASTQRSYQKKDYGRRSIFGTSEAHSSATPTPGFRFLKKNTATSAPQETTTASQITTKQGVVKLGTHIIHERFGRGTVKRIEGTGENAKISVDFDNAEEKQLLLRFARFTIE